MTKITSPMECKIVQNIKKEPFKTPREINMNLPEENQISPLILRRCDRMNGLIVWRFSIKCPLKPKRIQSRRNFASSSKDWDMRFRRYVLSCDKNSVQLQSEDRRQRVRRQQGERFTAKLFTTKLKFGVEVLCFGDIFITMGKDNE